MTPTPDRPARTAAEIEALEDGLYLDAGGSPVRKDCLGVLYINGMPHDFFSFEAVAKLGGIVDRLIPQSEARAELDGAVEVIRRIFGAASVAKTCSSYPGAGIAASIEATADDFLSRQGDTDE